MASHPSNQEEGFNKKKVLRSKVRKSLKFMDPLSRSNEDEDIQRMVLEAPWFQSCRSICAYVSCRDLIEVDTSKLIPNILQSSSEEEDSYYEKAKKLYVPRVENKNGHMRMLNITSLNDLIANSMKILEPSPLDCQGKDREDVMQAMEPLDLVLVPGLAFDRDGSRLGRGGGYYDNFLRKYQELAVERSWKIPLFVALSYTLQIMDVGVIPLTPNDVLVDAIVSPSGVLPISKAAFDRIMG